MRRWSVSRRILALVGVGGLLVVIGIAGGLGPLRFMYNVTISPIARTMAEWGSDMSRFTTELGQIQNLAKDNAALTSQNAQLRQRLAADAQTRSDNVALRDELGLRAVPGPREVAAQVTALEPDSYRQFVSIDVGRSSGVSVGQAVTSQGILAGLITSVSTQSSRVMLVSDPQFTLAATDQDAQANGLLQGLLGGGLELEQLDRTKPVKPGDTVTTAGLGGIVPAGLLVGQVESVDTRDSSIFQTAQLSSPLKTSEVRFVEVVMP